MRALRILGSKCPSCLRIPISHFSNNTGRLAYIEGLLDRMLNWYKNLKHSSMKTKSRAMYPPFQELSSYFLEKDYGIRAKDIYNHELYWAPRFILVNYLSFEFLSALHILKRKRILTQRDTLALVQLILTEAVRDTTYNLTYNYECEASALTPFHGNLPILIYNEEEGMNSHPQIPVILMEEKRCILTDQCIQHYNIHGMVATGFWMLHNYDHVSSARVIVTNGSLWQLWEVNRLYIKKTRFFVPEQMRSVLNLDVSLGSYNGHELLFDEKHLRTVVSLIRFAMNIEENVVIGDAIRLEEDVQIPYSHRVNRLLDTNQINVLPPPKFTVTYGVDFDHTKLINEGGKEDPLPELTDGKK